MFQSQPQLSMFSLMFKGKGRGNLVSSNDEMFDSLPENTESDAELIEVIESRDNAGSGDVIGKSAMQKLSDQENPFTNIISLSDSIDEFGGNVAVTRQTQTTTRSPLFTSVLLDSPPGPPVHDSDVHDVDDDALEDRVRQAMINVLRDIPGFGAPFTELDKSTPIKETAPRFHVHSKPRPREKLLRSILNPELGGVVVDNVDHLGQAVIDHPPTDHHLGGPVVDRVPHPLLHALPQPPSPPPRKEPPPPPAPTVTVTELDSKPGCRSFSTKTCTKVPFVVPKKVPFEECRAIPTVECYFVLKTVDDLECTPVRLVVITWLTIVSQYKSILPPFSYNECEKAAVTVPYLDTEEVCEDVEFEECVDAEVQVPIRVCSSVDPNR